MIRIVLLAAAMLASPALAAESHSWDRAAEAVTRRFTGEGRVVIRPGERVVVTIDENMRAQVQSVGTVTGAVLSLDQPVADGAVAFSLAADPQAGLVLKVENGLATPMVYGAVIGIGAGENIALAPTSICTVPPRVVGLESWRDPIVLIAIGPFARRDPGPLSCETIAAPPGGGRPTAAAAAEAAPG